MQPFARRKAFPEIRSKLPREQMRPYTTESVNIPHLIYRYRTHILLGYGNSLTTAEHRTDRVLRREAKYRVFVGRKWQIPYLSQVAGVVTIKA